MIERVLLSERTYFAGEQIALTAWGNSPMTAEILCFVRPPSPPQLRPCSECGKFNIVSGVEFRFTANKNLFSETQGYLNIRVTDSTGDQRELRIEIEGRTMTL
jgi:hypothetical protein